MLNCPQFGSPSVYIDPSIVSFTADPAVAEMGSTVPSIVLRWELAKTPLSLIVDNETLPLNTKLVTKDGPFTTNQSWAMSDADEEQTLRAKTTLSFQNKGYFGLTDTAPVDGAGILALESNEFAASKTARFTFLGQESGRFFCYAYPKRFGAPRVKLDVATNVWGPPTTTITFTDFTLTTVSFGNPSGFVEDYYVVIFNSMPSGSVIAHFS